MACFPSRHNSVFQRRWMSKTSRHAAIEEGILDGPLLALVDDRKLAIERRERAHGRAVRNSRKRMPRCVLRSAKHAADRTVPLPRDHGKPPLRRGKTKRLIIEQVPPPPLCSNFRG